MLVRLVANNRDYTAKYFSLSVELIIEKIELFVDSDVLSLGFEVKHFGLVLSIQGLGLASWPRP